MIDLSHALTTRFASVEDQQDVLAILKAVGNGLRLLILDFLAGGERSFQSLLQETQLQKTALANHLVQLLDAGLISKPDHGKYAITPDGALFLKAIIDAYAQSLARAKAITARASRGGLSTAFIDDFFRTRKE